MNWRSVVVFTILISLTIAVYFYNPKIPDIPSFYITQNILKGAGQRAPTSQETVLSAAKSESKLAVQTLRDPFFDYNGSLSDAVPGMPGGEIPDAGALFELQGVWIAGNSRSAFINDLTVKEGGDIMGWKVVKILPRQVTVRQGRESKILKLEDQ